MADAPAPKKLKKGVLVRIQCDGFIAEQPLLEDDAGGDTLNVRGLGAVKRDRLLTE